MKSLKLLAIPLLCLLNVPTAVLAATTDFTNHGHYLSDGISGLDWLDVTQTKAQEFDSVIAQFGDGELYDGWRLASVQQFKDLLTNFDNYAYTVDPHDGVYTTADNVSDPLMYLLGNSGGRISIGMLGSEEFMGCVGDGGYCVTEIPAALDPRGSDIHGTYLVRDTAIVATPIPAAVWLFGSALVGLFGVKRRK